MRVLAWPRSYRYLHYDVFTDHLFGGNQLAVVLDGRGLSDRDDAGDREGDELLRDDVRAAAGDGRAPTCACGSSRRATSCRWPGIRRSARTFALARTGVIERGREQFVFGCGIGPVPVTLTWNGDDLALRVDDAVAADLRRADAGPGARGGGAVAVAGGGRRHRAAGAGRVVRRAVSVRPADDAQRRRQRGGQPGRARRAAAAQPKHGGARRVRLLARSPATRRATVYSRMFAPELGIAEDPATGIASGPLGCYLVRHKVVPPEKAGAMLSLQGVKMGRPSHVHIVDRRRERRDHERARRRRSGAGGRRDAVRVN